MLDITAAGQYTGYIHGLSNDGQSGAPIHFRHGTDKCMTNVYAGYVPHLDQLIPRSDVALVSLHCLNFLRIKPWRLPAWIRLHM